MIKFETSKGDLDKIAREFEADKKEVEKASKRALKKTANWIKTQVVKELSRATGIKQKIIRDRLKVKSLKDLKASVWSGLNRISLMRLDPKQNKKGVRAGKLFRQSAFLSPIRKGSSKLIVYKRRGKERLPVDKQMVDIYEAGKQILESYIDTKAWERFLVIFRQEMKFQVLKRG